MGVPEATSKRSLFALLGLEVARELECLALNVPSTRATRPTYGKSSNWAPSVADRVSIAVEVIDLEISASVYVVAGRR